MPRVGYVSTPAPPDPSTSGRSGAKADHILRLPDTRSSMMLAAFVDRSKRKAVPIALGFFRRPEDYSWLPAPPMVEMLRGGRGGEVRLKVYLSMNLIAVKQPHDVTKKPAFWAALLGLPGEGNNGARRVGDAIDWLVERKFVRMEKQKGEPGKVFLLNQLGTGGAYFRPSGVWVNIPITLWQNGWIVTLSQAAIAMWIIIKEMQRGNDEDSADPVWIAPALARARYGLSDDTRTKGTRELERHGLLRIGRAPQGQDWEFDRLRNTYHLNLSRLDDRPDSVPASSATAVRGGDQPGLWRGGGVPNPKAPPRRSKTPPIQGDLSATWVELLAAVQASPARRVPAAKTPHVEAPPG